MRKERYRANSQMDARKPRLVTARQEQAEKYNRDVLSGEVERRARRKVSLVSLKWVKP